MELIMGISISAFTFQSNNLNSEYCCSSKLDAEKLSVEVDRIYSINESNESLSLSFRSYSNLKNYLDFLSNEINIEGFEHHFLGSEGVITNNECQELLSVIDKNMDKIKAITWKEYAFSYYSDYDDKKEFLDSIEHVTKRCYQSEQALMNCRFRMLITLLKFAVEQNGFIEYG